MKRRFKPAFGILGRVENDKDKCEEAIKKNIPMRFEIEGNQEKNFGSQLWDDIRSFDSYKKNAVLEHNDKILKYSQKHKLDPDIVRSVMYAENARGHKVILNKGADLIGKSESPLPMNIQKNRWASLIDKKPEDLYDPDVNIEAATLLLRRISDRIKRPTAEKVGSIWNSLSLRKTNEFGEYIGKVYKEKPWKKID